MEAKTIVAIVLGVMFVMVLIGFLTVLALYLKDKDEHSENVAKARLDGYNQGQKRTVQLFCRGNTICEKCFEQKSPEACNNNGDCEWHSASGPALSYCIVD
ncbi:uncharacterized protein LOC134263214 [Saccostrea cucullata]|uniref:uncharacterized protein LOC134263214 n=1 Tax=Saccostrea cuccullata TaxID=36930 RepID=UPI002ED22FF6